MDLSERISSLLREDDYSDGCVSIKEYRGPKSLYGTLYNGVNVCLIDGTVFRKTTECDFALGGHHYVYPSIPENEIWLEQIIDTDAEKFFITVHELVERTLMKYHGYDYEVAHQKATEEESCQRKKKIPNTFEEIVNCIEKEFGGNKMESKSLLKKILKELSEDKLPGGRADNRKPSDFDPKELEMGTKHEMEHTNDKDIAREIAMDHLSEDPKYYSNLKKKGLK